MDARQLTVFADVAERGSFTRAAAALGIAQPAVSQLIARLERSVGERLMRREGRVVVLTAAGRVLLPHAQQVAAALHEAHRAIEDHHRPITGRLRLGVSPGAAIEPTAFALAALAEHAPRLSVTVHTASGAQLRESCAAGDLDAAIVVTDPDAGDPGDPGRYRRLRQGRLMLRVAADHPWSRRARIALAELAGHRIAGFASGSDLAAIVHPAVQRAGAAQPEFALADPDLRQAFAAAGTAVGLEIASPGPGTQAAGPGGTRLLPTHPVIRVDTVLIWSAVSADSPGMVALLQAIASDRA